MKPLVGPAQRFDLGVGDTGKIRIHTYDRFTSWGEKNDTGE